LAIKLLVSSLDETIGRPPRSCQQILFKVFSASDLADLDYHMAISAQREQVATDSDANSIAFTSGLRGGVAALNAWR